MSGIQRLDLRYPTHISNEVHDLDKQWVYDLAEASQVEIHSTFSPECFRKCCPSFTARNIRGGCILAEDAGPCFSILNLVLSIDAMVAALLSSSRDMLKSMSLRVINYTEPWIEVVGMETSCVNTPVFLIIDIQAKLSAGKGETIQDETLQTIISCI